MFKGFNFKLPLFGTITPHTGLNYELRSMNVSEVSKLKTSLITTNRIPSLLNKAIWDSIDGKPDGIETYEDFLKSTTLRDREALIYGLYQATFGNDREFHTTCSNCNHEEDIKIFMDQVFSFEAYPSSLSIKKTYKVAKAIDPEENYDPEIEKELAKDDALARNKEAIANRLKSQVPEGMPEELAALEFGDPENDAFKTSPKIEKNKEEVINQQKTDAPAIEELSNNQSILNKRIRIELPISKVIVYIKQPTIWDEEQIFKQLAFAQKQQSDIVNETMIIDRFEQIDPNSGSIVTTVVDREDILFGYQSLPPRDKIKIFDEFQKEFGKYGIELKSVYNCSNCGEENTLNIDIVVQFFRMVALT